MLFTFSCGFCGKENSRDTETMKSTDFTDDKTGKKDGTVYSGIVQCSSCGKNIMFYKVVQD